MSTNKPTLTPIMQQYLDMKAENPDAILLFRLGDFYEAFFADAKILSKALNLVLTHRGTDERGSDIPMCGIPWHAAENYIARMVRTGAAVALAEQMETPEEAKARGNKQIERKVVRVMTPGTLTDDNLLSPKKSNFLVAVAPQSDSSFDFAGCDISTGEFFVGRSENIFDDMSRINPAEIIYPENIAETPEIKRLRESFATTPVHEKLYDRTDIDEIVSSTFQLSGSSTLADKLLAVYLRQTQRGANVAFRTPYRFGAGFQLLVDSATWKSLEIDSVLNDGGHCLLDILDKTRTAAGGRRLRAYLRQLSGDIGEIRRRQEHIAHLLVNRDVFHSLCAELVRLPDAGRSITRLISGRGAPRDLRAASDFLIALPMAKITGAKLDADMAAKFADIKTFDSFALELRLALSDALPAFFRDGGIIAPGFDDALDNMNRMAHGAKETIAALQAEYIKSTNVSTLKIKFNNILGYYIEVPNTRSEALMTPEAGFIHRQTMAGNMRFTTARLIDLDNEVRGAGEKAAAIEAQIIANLIDKVRDISDDLLATAELLANADVWLALADAAEEYGWVRPTMTSGAEFDVKNGRHPVVEYVLRKSGNQFVRNDCELNDKKIALLTGPNMAGKSTYLRQNALLVVLAHLGSFIPADKATIGICDQLFSRVGASDNLAAGQSTFMVEMQETANILNRATNKSFIIFDEIGRGTATYDGMAIAQAVLEFLDTLQPRTLFATHYHELTGLKFNAVKNLTVEVAEHNDEIIFMHKIASGVANRSYGIHVAQMAGMPESVVANASRILVGLENGGRANYQTPSGPDEPERVLSKVYIVRSGEKEKTQPSLFG
ncbi:MAG: DNA mismatch repair protein MutS [Alphaproteobacteria bacterium]|nr:DNA mismatch repair protein MutS [Alphaproteobacteria bacterium]